MILISFCFFGFSQIIGLPVQPIYEKCGSDGLHQSKLLNDPVYAQKMQLFEQYLHEHQGETPKAGVIYRIPVVVHVMSDGTNLSQITDDEIKFALKAINETYRKVPGTKGDGNGVDMEIEFELAVRDPNGNCTNGINRVNMTGYSSYMNGGVFGQSTGMSDATLKTIAVWDQTKYYNIWLVSEIDNNNGGFGIQGFAYFASAHGASIDGAVIMTTNFKNYASNTSTHELGHALNLYHTFQGDSNGASCPVNSNCNTDGDLVCDTPPHIRSASNCISGGTNSCDGGSSNLLYVRNFMDYSSESCQNMFTAGQKVRAQAAITVERASFLETSGNLSLVSPFAPTLDFISDKTGLCGLGQTINLYDWSSCIPNSYLNSSSASGFTFNWTITNGTNTFTSTVQNPSIVITAAGTYNVTLTVVSSFGTQTLTKNGLFVVSAASPTAACTPNSTNVGNFGQAISGVQFNTINNATSPLFNSGYTNYACSKSTAVAIGQTYPLKVSLAANSSGSEVFEAYLDYNNDGDFLDANEFLGSGSTPANTTNTVTLNVTIPAGAVVNTLLRLRIIGELTSISAAKRACTANYTIGDIEDYGVYISNKLAVVSIAATPGTTITYGTNVTFTATPTNGGSAPTYIWYKNNVIQSGFTGNTYSNNTLLPGDQIYCKMNSNLPQVVSSPANSNTLIMNVTGSPLSNFIANDTLVCAGTSISFSDLSLLSPTSWSWSFPGGTPSTSTAQNPTVTYATSGVYNVSLVASNGLGTGSTKLKSSYIEVSTIPGAQCSSFTRTNIPAGDIGIMKVKLGSINKITSFSDAVYQDFTCTEIAELNKSTLYPLELKVSSLNNQWVRVYIDYNGNNNFLDAGELIYSSSSIQGTINTTFTTPSNPNFNTILRMRVISDFISATSPAPGPCKSPLDYGQVEDYGVVIRNNCVVAAQPSAISGLTSCCANSTSLTYSVPVVSDVISYNWTVPAGATIVSGSGTSSIVVNMGSTSGNITVTAVNACGSSTPLTLPVTVIPNQTPTISISSSDADNVICSGTSVTFTAAITGGGATPNYQWKLNGANVGTNSSTYTNASLTNGAIVSCVLTSSVLCVTSSSANSNQITTVVQSPLSSLGTISGNANLCSGTTGNVYSVTALPSPVTFAWTIPSGSVITSGGSTNSMVMSAGTSSGNITVTATNSCGTSPISSKAITVIPSVNPTITVVSNDVDNTICSGTPITFTANITNGGSSPTYQWRVNGVNVGTNSPSFSTSSIVTSSNVDCILTSTATCANPMMVTSLPINVSVISVPATPSSITGLNTVCAGVSGLTYSVGFITGSSGYNWSLPAGWVITSGANSNSIVVTSGTGSGPISVSASNVCGVSGSSTLSIVTNSIPSAPTSMNGLTEVCAGNNGVAYSVSVILGATNYNWTLPVGATIGSGSGTPSITVSFGSISGAISVSAQNSCGTSSVFSLPITVNSIPLAPGSIVGNTSVCANSSGIPYSISSVSGALTYNWTVPGGSSIASGSSTNSIEVNFGLSSGVLSVTAQNSCGVSAQTSVPITVVAIPSSPSSISGISNLCAGSIGVVYSISSVPNATNYNWTVPNGSTITSGDGTNSIVVDYTDNSGDISVVAQNFCGSSLPTSLPISVVSIPSPISAIFGSSVVCANTGGLSYSISPMPFATSYTWTTLNGSTIESGNGTEIITLLSGTMNEELSVVGSNFCGTSNPIQLSISIDHIPQMPAVITGDFVVCEGETGVVYQVSNVNEATSYDWTLPFGSMIVNGQATDQIEVQVGSISGNIQVVASNYCGSSLPFIVPLTVRHTPVVPTSISGNMNVCSGVSGEGYSIPLSAEANWYNWSFPNGSNIIAGDSTATVSIETGLISGNITVNAENECGVSSTISAVLNITPTVTPIVTINSLPFGGAVCSGEGFVFEAIPTNGGNLPQYSWFVNGIDQGVSSSTFNWSSPVNLDEVYCLLTSSESCLTTTTVNSDLFPLTVYPLPSAPVIQVNGNNPFCNGQQVTLEVTQTTGIEWNNGVLIGVNTVSLPGPYSCIYTDSNGCVAASDTVILVQNELPSVTLNNLPVFCSVDADYSIVEGLPVNGQYSGSAVANGTFSPQLAGVGFSEVVYTYTDSAGCNNSDTVLVEVDDCTGIHESETLIFNLYPNPSSASVFIESNQPIEMIKVIDRLGRLVFEINGENTFEEIIDMYPFANGLYTFEVYTKSLKGQRNVIINK